MPNHHLLDGLECHGIDLSRLLETMNKRIQVLYDREHTIGHAYFLGLKGLASQDERLVELGHIFRNRIIPLLQEYFFDDWSKIRLVLGDSQKSEQHRFIAIEEVDNSALFNGNDLDYIGSSHESQRIYSITEGTAFTTPDSYIGIYTRQ
jgi:5-methylcytosine-specific restriction enzyme B